LKARKNTEIVTKVLNRVLHSNGPIIVSYGSPPDDTYWLKFVEVALETIRKKINEKVIIYPQKNELWVWRNPEWVAKMQRI